MDSTLVTIITYIGTSVIAFFVGKKQRSSNIEQTEANTDKAEAETAHLEVTTSREAVMIWRSLSLKLNDRVTELEKSVDALTIQLRLIIQENTSLSLHIKTLEEENSALRDQLNRTTL